MATQAQANDGGEAGARGSLAGRAVLALLAPAAALALFAGGLRNIACRWWVEPEWNHGLLAVMLVGLWLWRSRADWRALPLSPSRLGPVLVAAAAAMALAGELSATFFLSQYGLPLLAAGLVLSVWGAPGLRRAAMPLLLFAVVVPIPFFVQQSLAVRLQLLSSQMGVELLNALGIAALADGNVIDLGPFQLDVAEACSGLRYLFPLTGLAVIVAALYRGPAWAKALAVASAPPVAVAMNVVRIATVGLLVDGRGLAAAEGFLHLFEGWLVFLLCALLLVGELAVANRLVRPRLPLADRFGLPPLAVVRGRTGATRLPAAFLVSLAVLIPFAAATAALRARPDTTPPHPPLSAFPLAVGDWRGARVALPAAQAEVLGHPDYAQATFVRADGAAANLFVAYYDRQQQGTAIHSPAACLPAGGWTVGPRRTSALAMPGGAQVRLNRVAIDDQGRRQIVAWAFYQRGRWLTDEYAVKAALLWDSLRTGRTDGALVRLVTAVPPAGDDRQADDRIAALLRAVYPAIVRSVPR